jgi:hypothetical protein
MNRLNTYKASANAGRTTENNFKNLMISRGNKVRKASFEDDCANFVDFIIKPKKGKLAKVQVKNRNTPGRGCSPDDSHITLELKNTIGKDGWLYGDSDFLAKEVENGFYIYEMETLKEFAEARTAKNVTCTRLVDTYVKGMPYKIYKRKGTHGHKNYDELIYAKVSDIKDFFAEKGKKIHSLEYPQSE